MSWRLAKSLTVLREEFNALAPNRSKRSDGTIGDPAHASRPSRHNKNRYGVVTALDITHDPANGCDVHAIARRHVTDPHPELEYIISNRQVAHRRDGFTWRAYTGENPHTQHAHFAVGRGPDSDPLPPYDSTQPWGITPAQPEEDEMTPEQERMLTQTRDAMGRVERLLLEHDAALKAAGLIAAGGTAPRNLATDSRMSRLALRAIAAKLGLSTGKVVEDDPLKV